MYVGERDVGVRQPPQSEKKSREEVPRESRLKGEADPTPTATQETEHGRCSSARRAWWKPVSDVESKSAAAVRPGRGQCGARSRHREMEGHQALHNQFLILPFSGHWTNSSFRRV